MIYIKVEYKVKKDKVNEVKKAIKDFVNEIKKNEPGTLIYEAFQVNQTKFVHFMKFKDKESEEIHRESSYCKRFVNALYPHCEIEPIFTNLKIV